MIVPDANVLLYAVDEESFAHEAARGWLEEALSGTETVGLAWLVLLAFVRIGTNPRVFAEPLSPEEALDYLDDWLGRSNVAALEPSADHAVVLRRLVLRAGTAGNLTSDAHLAALAIGHQATLCSFDGDFGRFQDLSWTHLRAG